MRILLLHSSSDVYGASKIFLQTVKVFQQQGHTCHVVVSNEGPLVEQLRKCGAHVQMINLGIIRRKYFTPMGIINRISKCTIFNLFSIYFDGFQCTLFTSTCGNNN